MRWRHMPSIVLLKSFGALIYTLMVLLVAIQIACALFGLIFAWQDDHVFIKKPIVTMHINDRTKCMIKNPNQ